LILGIIVLPWDRGVISVWIYGGLGESSGSLVDPAAGSENLMRSSGGVALRLCDYLGIFGDEKGWQRDLPINCFTCPHFN
jgi:hypothetical protein